MSALDIPNRPFKEKELIAARPLAGLPPGIMMSEDWTLRIASHPRHGGGHVSRSLVLAEALREAKASVVLALDSGADPAAETVAMRGLPYRDHDTVAAPPRLGCILDGYDILRDEIAYWHTHAPFVAVLDDFLTPPDEADLVINGALHLSGDRVAGTPALLGPRFALVDPRYARLPDRDRSRPVSLIVVTFGRLDPDNVTGRVVEALTDAGTAARITVVAASAWPHLAALRRQLDALVGRGELLLDMPDMLPLLDAADLVIGAGGVSLMERMAAGVPSVTLSIVDNQDVFVDGAVKLDTVIPGGNAARTTKDQLRACLQEALEDEMLRARVAANGRRIVDGRGAARVAAHLQAVAADRQSD